VPEDDLIEIDNRFVRGVPDARSPCCVPQAPVAMAQSEFATRRARRHNPQR